MVNNIIPIEIILKANENEFLEGIKVTDKDKIKVPIYYQNKIVGFYTPRLTKLY